MIVSRRIKSLDNRKKKFLYSTVSSFGTKGISILVSLLTLPLIYKSIGTERYGMMLSITSIAAVITFADLGLGFGLQNRIPELVNTKDNSLHRAISSTFFFLVASSLAVFSVFFLFSQTVDWYEVLNLHSKSAISEVNASVYLFAFFLCLSIPFSIVQKIQIGFQEGYNTNIWSSAGSLMGLVTLFILYYFGTSTPLIITAIFGSNALFIIINFIYYFFFRRRDLFPDIHLVNFRLIKSVISDSSLFFSVQLLALVLFASNSALLVHYSGPEKVTEFNIAYKLLLLFMIPLESSAPYVTPVLNEALMKGDDSWIRKSISKGLLITILMTAMGGCIIYYLGNYIIGIWIGESAVLSQDVLTAVAFYLVLFSGVGCILSYVMLSSSFIRQKTIVYAIAVVVTMVVKVFAIKYYGVEGAIWSTTITMFVLYVVPCLLILKHKKFL